MDIMLKIKEEELESSLLTDTYVVDHETFEEMGGFDGLRDNLVAKNYGDQVMIVHNYGIDESFIANCLDEIKPVLEQLQLWDEEYEEDFNNDPFTNDQIFIRNVTKGQATMLRILAPFDYWTLVIFEE